MNNATAISKENNVQLGTVVFLGKPLTVITTDDQLLVAMRPICQGIGLDWKAQYERIKRDDVLSTSVVVMTTQMPGDDQRRQITCLPLDLLNGWLFGVEVKRCRQAIRPALIRYKRECYAALAEYWQKHREPAPTVQPQLPAAEPATEQRAFRGCNVLIAHFDGQPWLAAGNLCTALGLGGSDRITRSLPADMKRRHRRGARELWFIDLRGAERAADYCKPDMAEEYLAWLQRVAAPQPSLAPAPAVDRLGLAQLLDMRLLVSFDENGTYQAKPIAPDAMVVKPSRLAEVLKDPFTVPMECLPEILQVVASRMGSALKQSQPRPRLEVVKPSA